MLTDVPLAEIWQHLRPLRRAASARDLLSNRTRQPRSSAVPSEEADAKAHEIASLVEQADEYFQASRTVGLMTRPLIQFHGVDALAKAVVLVADRTATLSDLRRPGLQDAPAESPVDRVDLGHTDRPAAWAVEEESAITGSGLFAELARVSGDGEIRSGVPVRLRELLRATPDLARAYHRHYGEPSYCVRLSGPRRAAAAQSCSVSLSVGDLAAVAAVFPEFGGAVDGLGRLIRHAAADDYFIRPPECGVVSPAAVLYAASFLAGNLVRTRPAFWMRVLQGSDPRAAAMVETLCNVIELRFPQAALESIFGEDLAVESPVA
jgi:hypothetical protein